MLLDEAKDLSLSIGEIFQCRLLCLCIVYSTECQNTQALYFYRPFLPELFVEAGFEEFCYGFYRILLIGAIGYYLDFGAEARG